MIPESEMIFGKIFEENKVLIVYFISTTRPLLLQTDKNFREMFHNALGIIK